MMELAPSETGIPFDRLPTPRLRPVYRLQDVDIVVRRHPLEYQIRGQGMLRVHVAPPVDRLYPVVQRHSLVVAHEVPELPVGALGMVVVPRHRGLRSELRAQVGE